MTPPKKPDLGDIENFVYSSQGNECGNDRYLEKQKTRFGYHSVFQDGGQPSFCISLTKCISTTDSKSDIKSMFDVGSYNYSNNTDDEGIIIEYSVSGYNQSYITTSDSTKQPTNSTFNVTKHVKIKDNESHYITEGVFNCTFYHRNSGDSVIVTNGKFVARTNVY